MAEPSVDPQQIPEFLKWLGGIGAGVWTVWKYVETKLDKKADKSDVLDILKRLDKTNEHVEKLYENAEKDRRFTRDLHDKGMDTIVTNQREIMTLMRSQKP